MISSGSSQTAAEKNSCLSVRADRCVHHRHLRTTLPHHRTKLLESYRYEEFVRIPIDGGFLVLHLYHDRVERKDRVVDNVDEAAAAPDGWTKKSWFDDGGPEDD